MRAITRVDEAFEVYLSLGPSRSLVLVAETLRSRFRRAPSLRTIESWSARYGWQARLVELERRAREQSEAEHIQWVRDHRGRLRQEGLALQKKGLEWLRAKEHVDVNAGDSIRAIEAGFRLEALALGEATERIALEETDDRIERLTDEELAGLIDAARARDRGSPSGAGPTPAA